MEQATLSRPTRSIISVDERPPSPQTDERPKEDLERRILEPQDITLSYAFRGYVGSTG